MSENHPSASMFVRRRRGELVGGEFDDLRRSAIEIAEPDPRRPNPEVRNAGPRRPRRTVRPRREIRPLDAFERCSARFIGDALELYCALIAGRPPTENE